MTQQQEPANYVLTVHMPSASDQIARDLTLAEAREAMREIGKAYVKHGMNMIEAGIDYQTFHTRTGEMVGLWVHESTRAASPIRQAADREPAQRWQPRAVELMPASEWAEADTQPDMEAPDEKIYGWRDGEDEGSDVAAVGVQ